MPREKSFCEAEALARAAEVFAAHGFKGTSLAMLLEATGLGKQSLYNCFGDKRDLYLHAIDAAAARYARLRTEMRDAPTGRDALGVYYARLLDGAAGRAPEWRHCIVATGLLEQVDDPLVAGRLADGWGAAHELLRESVERGQKDGSVKNQGPSAELADLLVALAGGLRINASARFDDDRLRRSVALGLRALDG